MIRRFLFYLLIILNINEVQGQINLVGLTRGSSAKIIRYEISSDNLSSIYDFSNGSLPWYNDLLEHKGKLYGMTENGGTNDAGTIFLYEPVTSTFTILHNFTGNNGRSPYGSLVKASDDLFYGLTESGGAKDSGTIFSFKPSTSTLTTIHSFNGPDGSSPFGSLILAEGKIYGMTESGGTHSLGTIFSFNLTTNTINTIYHFNINNGRSPYGNLIQASNGLLYGMTQFGGTNRYGTIFSINVFDNTFITRHHFNWSNGAWPNSTLVEANGKLYGLTESGGLNFGVIFSISLSNHSFLKIYEFAEEIGRSPYGSFLLASDTYLYGMTFRGGINDKGILFSLNPQNTVFTKLKDFNGVNGANPAASLIQLKENLEGALPLKLLDFKIKAEGEKVILDLIVKDESDVDKYEAEKSIDGRHFTILSSIPARNNRFQTENYQFTDDNPHSINYYRVKIMEKNKAPVYTSIKKINFNTSEFKVQLKINPVYTTAFLLLNLPKTEQISFNLFDVNGRNIKGWSSKTFVRGEHQVQLQMEEIKVGIYFLEVKTFNQKHILKLIK